MSSRLMYVSESRRSSAQPGNEVTLSAITPLRLAQDDEGGWCVSVANRVLRAFRADDEMDVDGRLCAFSIEGARWMWSVTVYDDHLLIDKRDPDCRAAGDVQEIWGLGKVAQLFVSEIIPDYDAQLALKG